MKSLEAMASADNHKIIMMPLEASSLLGSIGGITEIAKETFGASKGKK